MPGNSKRGRRGMENPKGLWCDISAANRGTKASGNMATFPRSSSIQTDNYSAALIPKVHSAPISVGQLRSLFFITKTGDRHHGAIHIDSKRIFVPESKLSSLAFHQYTGLRIQPKRNIKTTIMK